MAASSICLIINEVVGTVQTPLFRAFRLICAHKGVNLIVLEGRTFESDNFADAQHNSVYQLISNTRTKATVLATNTLFSEVPSDDDVSHFLNQYQYKGKIACIGNHFTEFTSIDVDRDSGVCSILEHLIDEHLCQKLLFVSREEDGIQEHILELWQGLRNEDCALEFLTIPDIACQGGMLVDAIHQMTEVFDGIVFSEDILAIEYLTKMKQLRPKQLAELSIASIGHHPLDNKSVRTLTTIQPPAYTQMADDILEILMESTHEDDVNVSQSVLLMPKLSIGLSCGCQRLRSEDFGLESVLHSEEIPNAYRAQEKLQSFNKIEFFELLASSLPQLKVNHCYISVFHNCTGVFNDESYPDQCELIFCYKDGKHIRYEEAPVFNTEDLLPDDVFQHDQSQFFIIKPLFFQTQQYGYVVFDIESSSEIDLQFLHGHICHGLKGAILAEQYANVVDQVNELNFRLQNLSVTDELTGLLNRRGFHELAQNYVSHAKGLDEFTVFFADVDGLKLINDQFGHSEGDVAIKLVADTLRQTFTNEDLLARASGDEFVAISKGTNEREVSIVFDKMAESLKALNISLQKPYSVSFSCGYYCVGKKEREIDLSDLLKKADMDLYQCKSSRIYASNRAYEVKLNCSNSISH